MELKKTNPNKQRAISSAQNRSCSGARIGGAGHGLSETERAHIRPHLLNVSKAFFLLSLPPYRDPSRRNVFCRRPDRILFFVISHDLEHRALVIPTHGRHSSGHKKTGTNYEAHFVPQVPDRMQLHQPMHLKRKFDFSTLVSCAKHQLQHQNMRLFQSKHSYIASSHAYA